MTKIQILNEKQVDHYVNVLFPELNEKFNEKGNELIELAKKEEVNFANHAEVIKLKKEHQEIIDKANKVVALSKQLKEIDEDLYISNNRYYSNFAQIMIPKTDKEISQLLVTQEEEVKELLNKLARTKLHVDCYGTRKSKMVNELRARLSMLEVAPFETIKKTILESIDIITFFNNTITE